VTPPTNPGAGAARTADGVEIVEGMTVWTAEGFEARVRSTSDPHLAVAAFLSSHVQSAVWCELVPTRGMLPLEFAGLYSTRLAALTARAAALETELAGVRAVIAEESPRAPGRAGKDAG
jgi:hypothetical protein